MGGVTYRMGGVPSYRIASDGGGAFVSDCIAPLLAARLDAVFGVVGAEPLEDRDQGRYVLETRHSLRTRGEVWRCGVGHGALGELGAGDRLSNGKEVDRCKSRP